MFLVCLINGVCYFKSPVLKVSAQDNTACMLSINVCSLYNGLEILLYETDRWTGKWQVMLNINLEL